MIRVDGLQVPGESRQGQLRNLARMGGVSQVERDQRIDVAEGDRETARAEESRGHEPLARLELGDLADESKCAPPIRGRLRSQDAEPAAQLATEGACGRGIVSQLEGAGGDAQVAIVPVHRELVREVALDASGSELA